MREKHWKGLDWKSCGGGQHGGGLDRGQRGLSGHLKTLSANSQLLPGPTLSPLWDAARCSP